MAVLGYSCTGARRNIGFENCRVNAGNEKGHVLMPKGTTIDLDTVDFNLAYVNAQIQQGTFIWVSNCFTVFVVANISSVVEGICIFDCRFNIYVKFPP